MKSSTKSYAIAVFISIFILAVLYFIYNINDKSKKYANTLEKTFNDYSNLLISDHELNNSYIDLFKQSPESTRLDIFENGTLTNSGRMSFNMLAELHRNDKNTKKVDSLNEEYMKCISKLYLYYSINLKKLKDYENVIDQQVDSLKNYNNQAIKIVKELQNVEWD